MKKVIIGLLLGIVLGFIIGIIIFNIPSIKYDLNNNGQIDIADLIKMNNYYINH